MEFILCLVGTRGLALLAMNRCLLMLVLSSMLLPTYLLAIEGSDCGSRLAEDTGPLEIISRGSTFKGHLIEANSKSERERLLVELIQQTGLNPVVPDYRRIRDASMLFLALPAQVNGHEGVVHVSYDIYRFENLGREPKAIASRAYFVSEDGAKMPLQITRGEDGAEFSLSNGTLALDPRYQIYASISGSVVRAYLKFIHPFASSRMQDGSMVPAHNLARLAGVRSYRDAMNLRKVAQLLNIKNFLVEACKRYGFYTILGLTGVRQLILSLEKDNDPDHENEEEVNFLKEKIERIKKLLNEKGYKLIEDSSGWQLKEVQGEEEN